MELFFKVKSTGPFEVSVLLRVHLTKELEMIRCTITFSSLPWNPILWAMGKKKKNHLKIGMENISPKYSSHKT